MVNCKVLRNGGGYILRNGGGNVLRNDDTCTAEAAASGVILSGDFSRATIVSPEPKPREPEIIEIPVFGRIRYNLSWGVFGKIKRVITNETVSRILRNSHIHIAETINVSRTIVKESVARISQLNIEIPVYGETLKTGYYRLRERKKLRELKDLIKDFRKEFD